MNFIVFGQKIRVRREDLSEANICGYYSSKKKEIVLNSKNDPNTDLITIMHELGHALFDRNSINQAVDHSVEEIICDSFATVIAENIGVIEQVRLPTRRTRSK